MVVENLKVDMSEEEKCRLSGGFWDEETQTCSRTPAFQETAPRETPTTLREQQQREREEQELRKSEERTRRRQEKAKIDEPLFSKDVDFTTKTIEAPTTPERGDPNRTFTDVEKGQPSGITIDGETFLGLNKDDLIKLRQQKAEEQQRFAATGALTQEQRLQAAEGAELAGQVGQFGRLPVGGETPTDLGRAATAGLRGAIPSSIAGAFSIYGLRTAVALGAATKGAGVGSVAAPGIGTLIGGIGGFLAGITGGILSDMKSQRTDNTTAQQRVLDEGKQVLADWVSYARANPNDRTTALAGFNLQLAQIDRAYRQMQIDTAGDQLKFESAIPNLAEFEAFYNMAGERDNLVLEMGAALQTPASTDYGFMDMTNRRLG
tara:strand:- start:4606 stop:5736 length:1131 start_codon:yes stop_codon:yes gene_type:complete